MTGFSRNAFHVAVHPCATTVESFTGAGVAEEHPFACGECRLAFSVPRTLAHTGYTKMLVAFVEAGRSVATTEKFPTVVTVPRLSVFMDDLRENAWTVAADTFARTDDSGQSVCRVVGNRLVITAGSERIVENAEAQVCASTTETAQSAVAAEARPFSPVPRNAGF